jgi:hypothetical protein
LRLGLSFSQQPIRTRFLDIPIQDPTHEFNAHVDKLSQPFVVFIPGCMNHLSFVALLCIIVRSHYS